MAEALQIYRCASATRRLAAACLFVAAVASAGPAYGGLAMSEDLGSQTIFNDVLTTETSLDYTLVLTTDASSGQPLTLRVITNTFIDIDTGLRIFDYAVFNESDMDVLASESPGIYFYGEQWVGGSGVYEEWKTGVTDTSIYFYHNAIYGWGDDELMAGSSLTDSWGVGSARFYMQELEWVDVGVLKPTTVPEPATMGLLMLGAVGLLKGRRR